MKVIGLKSKLFLAFFTVLLAITLLNVGLAVYLTNQQGEREAFASLTRQSVLLQTDLKETITDLKAIAEKNVAGNHNLSDLATLYNKTQHLTAYPEQAAVHERGLLFNKIISLNRLQVILHTADFSSAAVYIDNELSHYLTTTEAGISTIRAGGRPLLNTAQNQDGELGFSNWPNWTEGDPPPLISSYITPVNRPTISFDFHSNQMMVLQILVPVQAVTRTVMRENITLSSPEGLLVEDLAIATPEAVLRSASSQDRPAVIGAFVFRKVFDKAFLDDIAQKTGLLPALYSLDGIHQIQITDMKIKPENLVKWALGSQLAIDPQIEQRILEVDRDSYYQTLSLWQFEEQSRLIIGFSQSTVSTSQKVRESVTGLVSISGLVLLVGGVLGYFLFDRLVKPIRALTAAVSGIGLNIQQGKQGQPVKPISSDKLVGIDLQASDEVGQLATAFNLMNRQLRQSFETLEQRVVERTEELQLAQFKLQKANVKLKRDKDLLQELSSTDHLTKLYNRAKFEVIFEYEIKQSQRYTTPLSLIMLDMDDFKKVNDTYGHQIGDMVLQEVATILANASRASDVIARWGGEEFLILTPKTNLQQAVGLAEKLCHAIEKHRFGEVGRKTGSFGVAGYRRQDTLTTLLQRADLALYQAKKDGKNRVVVKDGV